MLEPGAPETAQQRYLLARQMYLDGDLEGAAAEFRSALRLFPQSAKLAYNLARTSERLGLLDEAATHFRLYLELAPSADDRVEVERLIADLDARIAAQQPEMLVSTTPAGAQVLVDDADAPVEGTTPLRLRLRPGAHILRFRLAGHREATRTVDLAADASRSLVVPLEPDAAPAPEPAPVAAVETPAASAPSWLGWSLVATGVAATATGAVFLGLAEGTISEIEDLGPSPADRMARADLEEDWEAQRLTGWVGLGVGAAVAGAGLAVLLWPADEAPAVQTGWTGDALYVRGTF